MSADRFNRPVARPSGARSGDARWLAALALWLLATAWVRPLMLPDEGRYTGVAAAMLHGDALVPRLHGLPYFHKPPLMYWIDAAAMGLLGANEFAARIAPALGAWLMGAAIFLDLRRRVGRREALIALGVLATCPFFFIGAQYANHDMLVAGLITVAIVSAGRAADADSAPQALRWSVAAWLAAGLAVLAKGLIGVVLPALVLLPALAWQRRWGAITRLLHPLALLAFAAIVAPWFAAMAQRFPGFLDYFFLEQHVRRFAQGGFNNAQPWWFFVPVVLLLTLPWSLWLPAWSRRGTRPVAAVALPYAWWIAAVLVFFSLPQSKLVGYALPALAPLAALCALAAARGRAWRWALPAAALACVVAVVALARHDDSSQRALAQALRAGQQPGERVVFVGRPFFELPFYAGLADAPMVLTDWDSADIDRHDDWRKELRDAARFDPAAAQRVLLRPAALADAPCAQGAAWFVAPLEWRPPPSLDGLERAAVDSRAALWRLPAGRRACPGHGCRCTPRSEPSPRRCTTDCWRCWWNAGAGRPGRPQGWAQWSAHRSPMPATAR